MIYTNEIIKKKYKRINNIRKIFQILILPFIILVLIISCYIGYMRYIQKETNISIFGYNSYIVSTGSMEPTYQIGDLIIIRRTAHINVDDVITFSPLNKKDNTTITHRVIDIVNEKGKIRYKTKGDNNSIEDSDLVNPEQIQGIVVFKVSKLGIIVTKIISGTGIAIIIFLFILSYLHTNSKEEKRIAREDARRLYNIPKYKKEDA